MSYPPKIALPNQIHRTLFWIIWIFTLESQAGAPTAKERGPAFLSVKQRKSIIWFLVHLLKELANDAIYLSVEERNALFELLELTWAKLGSRGRRDTIVSIALAIQDHIAKKNSLVIGSVQNAIDRNDVQAVVNSIDTVYAGIAEEARKYVLEAPVMAGLTKAATEVKPKPQNPKTPNL